MVKISVYDENSYEQSIIELFQNLGYNHYYGPDIERDYKNPLFKLDLENLYSINKTLDTQAVDKAIEVIQDFGIASLEDINNKFMSYLQNGISVNYWKDGKEKSTLVKLIDFENLNSNLDYILDLLFKENFIDKFNNDDTDWKIKKVGELPLIITDYVANGSFASLKENVSILDYEDYAYFIRNTDLKSKCFEKFVNKHSYDFLKKSSLFGNEIIISNVGDVGSVFLCPFLDKPMTLGNNMILVKSNNDAIYLNFYLFLLFRSNYGQYLISTITAGSVQSKFNKTEFKSLELTMPDDELIIRFNEIVSPIFEYKNKISDEITNLTKLRDTLLPKLMSGEIDVSKINCDLE